MNAATTAPPAAAHQPALTGLPPPPVQTPAPPLRPTLAQLLDEGEPVRCCFIGRLAEAASLPPHPQHGERLGVQVLVQQHVAYHPQACPVLATWHPPAYLGPDHANRAAAALAAALPAGTEIVVLGVGLETSHHHGQPVLRVLKVLGLKPNDALAPTPAANEPDLFATPNAERPTHV